MTGEGLDARDEARRERDEAVAAATKARAEAIGQCVTCTYRGASNGTFWVTDAMREEVARITRERDEAVKLLRATGVDGDGLLWASVRSLIRWLRDRDALLSRIDARKEKP